jgi:membrane protease subunit HflC
MRHPFSTILIAVLLFVGYNSFFVLNEGKQALVIRLGKPQSVHSSPGLRFKAPFIDAVKEMEKRILGSDTPPAEYLTLDKKKLVADPISRWKIVDPLKFYRTVHDEYQAKTRLDDIVNSELRGQIANRDFGAIIGNKREDLVQRVATAARNQLAEFGIDLVDVRIKRADLPREVQESVFQRMRAERDRIAKKYRSEGEAEARKIEAEADKQREIVLAQAYEEAQKIRGEGDAKSISIYAEAFEKDPEFYSYTRSLEAYERVLDAETQIVLSTDNRLLRYLEK